MLTVAQTTWFESLNYGSVLQAYALGTVLRGLGCDVRMINYDPAPRQWEVKSALRRSRPFRLARKAQLDLLGASPFAPERKRALFADFASRHFALTRPVASDEEFAALSREFDAFVCGSDQIWSPRCFDPRYFLDYVSEPEKKIAYAPSFGCDSLTDAQKEAMAPLVSSFGHLSAREAEGARMVEGLAGRGCEVVLDPTLLIVQDGWEAVCSVSATPSDAYCLCYFLGDDRDNWARALQAAKCLGLAPAIIPVFRRDAGRPGVTSQPVGPAEFVGLFERATYVCTDSFHGLVFSTLFKKPFTVYERFAPGSDASQNVRIDSYLELVGLQGRLGRRQHGDPSPVATEIDYDLVGDRLAAARRSSIAYLQDSLRGAALFTAGGATPDGGASI